MTTVQKIAAFIFRITAVGLILYSVFIGCMTKAIMGGVFWSSVLIYLVAGVALFASAIPLSKIATIGLPE